MNTIWETLGIEPTNELRTIKRAYAEMAKIYHPEEAPEAFQRLHEAYEYALLLARAGTAVPETQDSGCDTPSADSALLEAHHSFECLHEIVPGGANAVKDEKADPAAAPEPSYDFDKLIADGMARRADMFQQISDALLSDLREQYQKIRRPRDLKEWRNLVGSDRFCQVQHFPYFVQRLTELLNEPCRVPYEVQGIVYAKYHFEILESIADRGIYSGLYDALTRQHPLPPNKLLIAIKWLAALAAFVFFILFSIVLVSAVGWGGVVTPVLLFTVSYLGCDEFRETIKRLWNWLRTIK